MPDERLDAKITIGSASYFVHEGTPREGRNALVVGPRRPSSAIQHHLTVVSNVESGLIDNIHFTGVRGNMRTKKWQLAPEEIEPMISKWIKGNSIPVARSNIREMGDNYYCVSGWRVFACFRVLEGMMMAAMAVFVRPLISLGLLSFKKETQKSGRVRETGQLNLARVLALAQKVRPFRRVVRTLLPVVVRTCGPKLLGLFLIRPERMARGDVSVLVPKRPAFPAVVLVKWRDHRQVDLGKLIEHASDIYHRMELREIMPNPAGLSSNPQLPFVFDIRRKSAY